MYKVFFSLIIIILIGLTAVFCTFKPEMHKTVFVYDSAYEITEPKDEVQPVKKDTVVIEVPIAKIETQKSARTTLVQKQSAPVTKVQAKPKTTVVKKTVQKAPVQTTQKNVKNAQTTSGQTQKNVQTKSIVQSSAVKQVTEEEKIRQETILWNKWRSDLQNQIMKDTKLPTVPQGTVFKFSFDVDKYGKVTNVHTWSTNPAYTPYAIQFIAPVIRSYQGRAILEFPAGSNRVATTVEGAWKISQTSKYSTSADYNDSERVSR